MAELVDALDSKSGDRKVVRVRFPSRPPHGFSLLVVIMLQKSAKNAFLFFSDNILNLDPE